MLTNKGVTYLWYYIYRPAGENPATELALDEHEIRQLREHTVSARTRSKLLIIDTYWDETGKGLCPAATGLSHHINASGYIEPCPVIQFSTDRVENGSLNGVYEASVFLENFRKEIPSVTSGCIFMEDPVWLADFVEKHGQVGAGLCVGGLNCHAISHN